MTKNNKKTNKAIELLYELSLRDDFQKDIRKARKLLKIPLYGFKSVEEKNNGDPFDAFSFTATMLNLLEKYQIPDVYWVPLQEYLEFDRLETKEDQIKLVGFVDRWVHREDDRSDPMEEWYKYRKQPFVKLIIFGNNTKSDVHAFIDKNWKIMEEILTEQGDEPKRVRRKKDENKERDRIIIELSKKTKKELNAGLKRKLTHGAKYKELLIQAKMEELGYGEINEGYIRKIISKYRR